MLLIYTPTVTARIRYIFDLMIRDMLGISFSHTRSPDEYRDHKGPKLWYDSIPPENGLFLEPAVLLYGHDISPVEPGFLVYDGVPALFPSGNPASILPFDPFAAAFYMVSRYEEYLPHEPDLFGRFRATDSIAFRKGFLGIPVVHRWAGIVGDLLESHFPGMAVRRPAYRFTPTIDIDHAYCFLGRTPARTLGGIGRSVIRWDPGEIYRRIRVLSGRSADPYDTYSYIREVHEPGAISPRWFVLFADYGGDDNNVMRSWPGFRKLLLDLDGDAGVGIHPSLTSCNSAEKLEEEYNGLCSVLGRGVTISRQHFLKFTLPATYRRLAALGIRDDYSMGYASSIGFRAGMAMPFPFFDLPGDEVSGVTIHPLSVMDVTLRDHLRLTPEAGLELIAETIRVVRDAGGEFVSLWHNESLDESGRWKGWRTVYREMVRMASA